MKKKALIIWIVCIIILACFFAYQSKVTSGKIYLYGEEHGASFIIDREFELWSEYYHKEGMRHLFIEEPYYGAQFLNLWMQSDNNKLLDELFEESEGTPGGELMYQRFYEKIKKKCPETVFHGTDIGHRFDVTGERYLEYLCELGKANSKEYKRAKEVMEQGVKFYETNDFFYRENKMVENFMWEFEQLKGESIMGIYGDAHVTEAEQNHLDNKTRIMVSQLQGKYGDRIYTESLVEYYVTNFMNQNLPEQTLEINGNNYKTIYFGEFIYDPLGKNQYDTTAKIWEVEEGKTDFERQPTGKVTLKSTEYPLPDVKYGGIYVWEFYQNDEFVERKLFRADTSTMGDGTIMTREILY